MAQASPSVSRLDRSQHARRKRIIAAVVELLQDGGYDAVQLRAVSDRSNVALGSIYSYFGSRDGLLGAALSEWSQAELYEPLSGGVDGDTPEERLLSVYRHLASVYEANPH